MKGPLEWFKLVYHLTRYSALLCCHGHITIEVLNEARDYLMILPDVDGITAGRPYR